MNASAVVRFWDRVRQFRTPLFLLSCRGMAHDLLGMLRETGAYLEGHFRLTSGLHSREYLQCAKLLAWPQHAEAFGWQLAAALREVAGTAAIQTVVSPAIGGIVIGHEVGRAFGTRAIFAERDAQTRAMTLRRGFSVEPGTAAVVVEDVITTGGSTREVIKLLQKDGVHVVAAGSLIDRSGGTVDLGVPRTALQTMNVETFSESDCPLCRAGVPVVKPGSRPEGSGSSA